MENIEIILNKMHYCYYKMHAQLHVLSRRYNPVNLIHKLPFQKKRYEALGIDIQKEIDKAFLNNKIGLSIIVAGGLLMAILYILFFSIATLLIGVFTKEFVFSLTHYILIGTPAILVSYFFVFKSNKYEAYFNKFSRWTVEERKKNVLLTIVFTIVILFLFIVTF